MPERAAAASPRKTTGRPGRKGPHGRHEGARAPLLLLLLLLLLSSLPRHVVVRAAVAGEVVAVDYAAAATCDLQVPCFSGLLELDWADRSTRRCI